MNFKLDNEIVEKLNNYSAATMIPKTRVVEKALGEFFERAEKRDGSGDERGENDGKERGRN